MYYAESRRLVAATPLQECGTFRTYPDGFIGNLRHGDILCPFRLLFKDDRHTFLSLPNSPEFEAVVSEKRYGFPHHMAVGADAGHLLSVQSS